jgi:hypothetical protein
MISSPKTFLYKRTDGSMFATRRVTAEIVSTELMAVRSVVVLKQRDSEQQSKPDRATVRVRLFLQTWRAGTKRNDRSHASRSDKIYSRTSSNASDVGCAVLVLSGSAPRVKDRLGSPVIIVQVRRTKRSIQWFESTPAHGSYRATLQVLKPLGG